MAKYDKQEIWKHNSFRGHAKMMEAQCNNIIRSNTATQQSKQIAREILKLADELGQSLRTRADA